MHFVEKTPTDLGFPRLVSAIRKTATPNLAIVSISMWDFLSQTDNHLCVGLLPLAGKANVQGIKKTFFVFYCRPNIASHPGMIRVCGIFNKFSMAENFAWKEV